MDKLLFFLGNHLDLVPSLPEIIGPLNLFGSLLPAMSTRTPSRRGASKASGKKKAMKPAKMPGWLLLLTGFCAGFFLASLINLTPSPVDIPPGTNTEPGQPAKASEPNPVFDFYTLLPESEVILPEVEQRKVPVAVAPPEQEPAPVVSRKSARYLLQAGSFRNASDADRLRAQLLLSGLDARVERVRVGSGEYWHRVQLGPFEDRGELDNAQGILADMKIDSLLLRLKQP